MAKRIDVSTLPTLALESRQNRQWLRVEMLPTAIEAGNTGRIHVGLGFEPSATLGAPNQGEVLNAGGEYSEYKSYADDPTVFKGIVYVTASAANQIIVVSDG